MTKRKTRPKRGFLRGVDSVSDKMILVLACAGRGLDEELHPLFRQGQMNADLAGAQAIAMHPHHRAAQRDRKVIDAVVDDRAGCAGERNSRRFDQAFHRFRVHSIIIQV